jgi:catechol 2,3-dioxygenase-like lactoylglutathione lyase family enzyme
MVTIIENLVNRFERGSLSRRDLIRGLAMLAATAGTAAAQDQPAIGTPTGIQATKVDHVGILVSDLPRSVDFYTKTFGLVVVSEDKAQGISRVGLGKRQLCSLNKSDTPGRIDHVAIAMDNFTEAGVAKHLADIGVKTSRTPAAGFHVDDPDGFPLQIVLT